MRLGILAVAILAVLATSCTRVSPGYEGIQVDLCADDEKQAVTPLAIGRHFEGYCENILTYPLYKTRYVFTASEHEGSPVNEQICANDKDGMKHCFDVGVTIRTVKGKAGKVYASFRSYEDNIEGIVKGPAFDILRDSFNQVIRNYKAQQVYASKKGEIRDNIRKMFKKRLERDGLTIDELTLNDYRPPASVVKAIDAKVRVDEEAAKARAEAMKVKAIEAKKTITAEEKAKRAKITADAAAYVRVTKAEAEAKANKKITSSLTRDLIEYTRIKNWDGKLPQVTGSATPLLQMK
jgi:hypothetical protein